MKKSVMKEAFVKAYNESFGNVSAACLSVKVDRSTYYEWIKKDLWFKQMIEDCDESFLDFAESKLHKKIADGEWVPLKYYLENRAKKRGWSNTDAQLPTLQHSGTIKIEISKNIIQGNAK